MSTLVKPHGAAALKPLLLEGEALNAERRRAETLPKVNISSREVGDLIMLGIGGFTPLDGFMTRADRQGVCDGMKLANGLFWPNPLTHTTEHPCLQMVMNQGTVNLAGPVKVLSQGRFPTDFADVYMTPAETRKLFEAKGWNTVVAFQTRNPLHRSHEYLVKIAIEICDGV